MTRSQVKNMRKVLFKKLRAGSVQEPDQEYEKTFVQKTKSLKLQPVCPDIKEISQKMVSLKGM